MTALGVAGFSRDRAALSRNLGAVAMVHAMKTLLSLPVAAMIGGFVHRELGHSPEAERFAAALEPSLLLELQPRAQALLQALPWLLLAALPVLVLLLVFLDGALLRLLTEEETQPQRRSMVGAGGRAFGGLIRLLPFGFAVMVLLGLLPGYGLHRLGLWLTEAMRDERLVFLIRATLLTTAGLGFFWVKSSYGVARAFAANGESLRVCLATLFRNLRSPRRLLLASLPWTVLFVFATLALSLLDVRVGRTHGGLVLLGILIQQLSSALRTLFGAGLLATYARVARSERADAGPAAPVSCDPPGAVLPVAHQS